MGAETEVPCEAGACEAAGPRVIVFDVAGTIELQERILIHNGDLTIAGQTAPGEGITLKNYGITIYGGGKNVIIRNIRIRVGDRVSDDNCIWTERTSDVIIDHCTFSWAINKGVSSRDSDRVTVQWCLVSECLFDSVWWGGRHSRGALIYGAGGKKFSFHHNLMAHNDARNPRTGGMDSPDEDPIGYFVDVTNNVMYDWGRSYVVKNLDEDAVCTTNIRNNYMIAGPSSNASNFLIDKNINFSYILEGNYMNGKMPADQYAYITYEGFKKPATLAVNGKPWKLAEPFDAMMDNIHDARTAYAMVLANGGASVARDAVDRRVINDVLKGTGRVIDSQDEVGGWPVLNTDPTWINAQKAAWEAEHGFHPYDEAYCNEIDPETGYTYLELFCNGLMEHLYDENMPFRPADMRWQFFRNIGYRAYRAWIEVRNFFTGIWATVQGWFGG